MHCNLRVTPPAQWSLQLHVGPHVVEEVQQERCRSRLQDAEHKKSQDTGGQRASPQLDTGSGDGPDLLKQGRSKEVLGPLWTQGVSFWDSHRKHVTLGLAGVLEPLFMMGADQDLPRKFEFNLSYKGILVLSVPSHDCSECCSGMGWVGAAMQQG